MTRMPYWLWLAKLLMELHAEGRLSSTQVKKIFRGEFHDIGIHPFDDDRTVEVQDT